MRLISQAQADTEIPQGAIYARLYYGFPLLALIGFGIFGWTAAIVGLKHQIAEGAVYHFIALLCGFYIYYRVSSFFRFKRRSNWLVAISSAKLWLDVRPLYPFKENNYDFGIIEFDQSDVLARCRGTSPGTGRYSSPLHWLDLWLKPEKLQLFRELLARYPEKFQNSQSPKIYTEMMGERIRINWNNDYYKLRPLLSAIPNETLRESPPPEIIWRDANEFVQDNTASGPAADVNVVAEAQARNTIAEAQIKAQPSLHKQIILIFCVILFGALMVWTVNYLNHSLEVKPYYGRHDHRLISLFTSGIFAFLSVWITISSLRNLLASNNSAAWVAAFASGKIWLNVRSPLVSGTKLLSTPQAITFAIHEVESIHLIKTMKTRLWGANADNGRKFPGPTFLYFKLKGPILDYSPSLILEREITALKEMNSRRYFLFGLIYPSVLLYGNGFAVTWVAPLSNLSVSDFFKRLPIKKGADMTLYISPQQDQFLCPSAS